MKTRGSILAVMGMSFAILTGLQLGPFMTQSMSYAAEMSNNEETENIGQDFIADGPSKPVKKESCFTEALATRLWADSEAVEARHAALNEREATLLGIESEVEIKLAEVEATKQQIEAFVNRLEKEATDDIDRLVTMYSTMKPAKAADIFDRMDPSFSAGLLRQMEPSRAGMIMAEMGADKSYRISLMIANRNAAWRAVD
jgi:flagellar motility protein MotE (MotC chaperone)